jgi:hypothetical protein
VPGFSRNRLYRRERRMVAIIAFQTLKTYLQVQGFGASALAIQKDHAYIVTLFKKENPFTIMDQEYV